MEKIRKGEMALVDNGQTVHPPQNSANRTVWDSFYFNKKVLCTSIQSTQKCEYTLTGPMFVKGITLACSLHVAKMN